MGESTTQEPTKSTLPTPVACAHTKRRASIDSMPNHRSPVRFLPTPLFAHHGESNSACFVFVVAIIPFLFSLSEPLSELCQAQHSSYIVIGCVFVDRTRVRVVLVSECIDVDVWCLYPSLYRCCCCYFVRRTMMTMTTMRSTTN